MQNPNMTPRSKVLAQNVLMTVTVTSVDAGEGLRAFQIAIKTDVPLPPYLAKSVNAQTVEGLASLKDVAAFEKGTKTGTSTDVFDIVIVSFLERSLQCRTLGYSLRLQRL